MADHTKAASRPHWFWLDVYCRFVNGTCSLLVASYIGWRLFS